MTRIAFLDRDGVLNRALLTRGSVPVPPHTLAELELLPRVEDACRLLRQSGFRLVLVTNQPDVARGTQTREAVEAINEWLAAELGLDEVQVCWHDDADGCGCRKPEPGLLLESARRAGVDLAECVMVGDRWRDVEAGRRAGCRTVLIGDGYGEPFPAKPDVHVGNLWDACLVLTQRN